MKHPSFTSFMTWRKCFCQLYSGKRYTNRGHSTFSSQITPDNNLNEQFKQEDFSTSEDMPFLDIDPEIICVNNIENQKKVKLLQTEVHVLKESGDQIPEYLKPKQWKKLLGLDSSLKRRKYLHHLWLNEQVQKDRKKTKVIQRKLHIEKKEKNTVKGPIIEEANVKYVKYGLNFNTLFRGIYTNEMNKYYYYRLLKAMMFGPDIIVDCGFDRAMSTLQILSCARDILKMWQENKIHANPFNIRFCNMSENSLLLHQIKEIFLGFDEPDLPFNFTSQSYLDLYERKNLVYLTPYADRYLQHYDPTKFYIIGALTNNRTHTPLSLAKAKKENLCTAKFPLKSVDWNIGPRSMDCSKTLAVMNDLKEKYEWRTIFEKNLPVQKTPQQTLREKKENEMQIFTDSRSSSYKSLL